MKSWKSLGGVIVFIAGGACADDAGSVPVDARDARFLMIGKADGPGIDEASAEACAVMAAANAATAEDLDEVAGLDARAARGIVEARPLETLAALDAVPYVGPVAFERLVGFAVDAGYRCDEADDAEADDAEECSASGGTYDGVRFTAASECKAVAFLNGARMSDLRALPDMARRIAYDHCVSGEPCLGYRYGLWTSMAEFAATQRIAETAVRAVAKAAAGWQEGGPSYDTVQDVWTRRAELSGAPLTFEKVYVSRGVFLEEGAYPYYCVEVRDAPDAPNYLHACLQYINADSAPGCTVRAEECMGVVGRWVWMRGTLRRSSVHPGGYKVNLVPDGPHAANPELF